MDWRHPEAALGGSLDTTVLGVLWHASDGMTGLQVARVAADAGSPRGIAQALKRLVKQGIADVDPVGGANVYRVNREHLTFPAVDAAFQALRVWPELRTRVRTVVDAADGSHADDVTVAVFGSVARGEARLESDVDLLVITPDDTDDEHVDALLYTLATNVRRWTGQQVQIYATTPSRLRAARDDGDPIVASLLADARVLTGPDVRTALEAS